MIARFLPRFTGRRRSARPLLRACALAAVGSVADGLHAAGCFRVADFAVRLKEPLPRGVAILFLALGRLGRLRVWPGHLDTLSRLLPHDEFLRAALRSPRQSREVKARFTLHDEPTAEGERTPGRLFVDYDYFNLETGPDTVIAPFFLHPHYYASGLYRRLPGFRQTRRKCRLFFAGTSEPASYSRAFASDIFGMMNRAEVLSAVMEDFPGETLVVRRREDLPGIARSDRPIILVLTDRTEDNLKKHLLRPAEYLRLLAGSAFALCPPGWRIPHCHNLIEAMAVGVAPVLSYASWCHPPLVSGHNCLTFRDRDELRATIRNALDLPETEVTRLGAEAASHYATTLSVEAFAARLEVALKGGSAVRVRFANGEESVRRRIKSPDKV